MNIRPRPDARTAPYANGGKSVLIIKFGDVADLIQALPAVAAIREHHVGARVTLLTHEPCRALAEAAPYFDIVEAGGKPRDPQGVAQLIARIRAAKFDMVYDFEMSARTNNYYLALRPWPPCWSGAPPGVSHPFDPDAHAHLHGVDRYCAQARAAGVLGALEGAAPDLSWAPAALHNPPRLQPAFFGLRGAFILLAPNGAPARVQGAWPKENYAELARRIAARGVTPVAVGEPSERAWGAAVGAASPRAKNLVGRADLFQIVALAGRAAYCVGEDGLALIAAAAAGAACLELLAHTPDPDAVVARGAGPVIRFTAASPALVPVEQVDRALARCGAYPAATA